MHRRRAEWLLNALRRGAAGGDRQGLPARTDLYPLERKWRVAAGGGLARPMARPRAQLGYTLATKAR